jgi:hypothetical protein
MLIKNNTPNSMSLTIDGPDMDEMTGVQPGGTFTPTNVSSGQSANVIMSGNYITYYSVYWLSPTVSNDGTVTMSVTVE